MRRKLTIGLTTLCLMAGALAGFTGLAFHPPVAQAGEFNETLKIGDAAPAWSELPGVDGKAHSLADLKDKAIIVVAFTCNSCPVAVAYEERLKEFVKQYADKEGGVALVAINVNKVDDDRLPKMQERAKSKGFNFPYLYDDSQKIAKAYGANFTPEFFVLDKERKVVYMGRMDDNPETDKVKTHYVELAVQAALKGEKPATAETLGVGCRIRYVRERKKN